MIVMGRVGAPFGIKGWIKVQPFTRTVDGLLEHPAWWLGRDGSWGRSRVEDGAVHGRSLIAKLEGCEDRRAAARLKGLEVAIPRDELPASAGQPASQVLLLSSTTNCPLDSPTKALLASVR